MFNLTERQLARQITPLGPVKRRGRDSRSIVHPRKHVFVRTVCQIHIRLFCEEVLARHSNDCSRSCGSCGLFTGRFTHTYLCAWWTL